MTQEQLKEFSFKLINTLVAKGCYIKGYGKMYRVCDKEHRPEINITRQQFDVLVYNKIVVQSELIWTVNVIANPFANSLNIKLPIKENIYQ